RPAQPGGVQVPLRLAGPGRPGRARLGLGRPGRGALPAAGGIRPAGPGPRPLAHPRGGAARPRCGPGDGPVPRGPRVGSPPPADQVLREVVAPVTRSALATGVARRWFFLRYGDPDWHLRWRFQGDPGRLWAELVPALRAAAAPLLEDGRIWKVQFDTYERE